MKHRFIAVMLCGAILSISAFGADATAGMTDDTTQQSSDQTTDQSTGASSEATTDGSVESSAEIGATGAGILSVAGAVVAVGLTVVGFVYVVRIDHVQRENVVRLQDQIYVGHGPDLEQAIRELGVSEAAFARANDELVVAGYVIETDQDAADYLLALLQKLDLQVEVEPGT